MNLYYTEDKSKKGSGSMVRKARKVVSVVLVLLLLFVAANFAYRYIVDEDSTPITEWNLTLVNKWNKIPKNYDVELTELSNGQCIDTRIYPDLQNMFDDARAEGVYPTVGSGYRTAEKQQSIMDDRIAAYKAEGYSDSESKKLAEAYVADTGTSEHQLGIAIDINADDTGRSTNDDVYEWLYNNAYKYGFILRYPSDKTDITGVSYEPWHYRYVGAEAAAEIYNQKICLEEYLDNVK